VRAPTLRIPSRRTYAELDWVGEKTDPTIELAYREDSHASVALLWNREDGTLKVSVHEVATENPLELIVGEDEALDAFYHPYAYAARAGA
jgi:hypothetical protein